MNACGCHDHVAEQNAGVTAIKYLRYPNVVNLLEWSLPTGFCIVFAGSIIFCSQHPHPKMLHVSIILSRKRFNSNGAPDMFVSTKRFQKFPVSLVFVIVGIGGYTGTRMHNLTTS